MNYLSFQKFFIFLFLLAITSKITIQSVVVAGQQLNSFEERPLTKTNFFHVDSSDDDGVIIIAAFRRRGGNFRGKYKKVSEVTTKKVIEVTTEKVTSEEATKDTLEEPVKVSTVRSLKDTTVKAVKVTTEEPLKTTTVESVNVSTEKALKATTVNAVKVTTEEPLKTTTVESVKVSTEKALKATTEEELKVTTEENVNLLRERTMRGMTKIRRNEVAKIERDPLWLARKRVTRPPKSVPTKKPIKVNVIDEEDYSLRRARYLFSQRSGK